MGCAGSRTALFVKDSPLSQALERKLVEAIIGTKRRKSFVVKKSSFNNLMLQLPRLTAGFKKIRESHVAISGSTGKVTWGAFRTICKDKLGLDPESASVQEVLSMPDIAEGVMVTHADLIVIYTVIFILDNNARQKSIPSPEIRACLELMEKSFMFFDSSADGCIERKELAMAMKSGTRVFGRKASKNLADQLFDQLDWSKDGQITFKEFLIGMERIIIETAGDEEDGMAEDDDIEYARDMDEDLDEEEVKQMGGAGKVEAQKAEAVEQDALVPPSGSPEKAPAESDVVRPFTLSGTGAL